MNDPTKSPSSHTSTTDTSSTPSPAISQPTNVSHFLTVKLNSENYLIWKAQMLPYLYGQRYFCYIDGSSPPPPSKLPDGVPNPSYIKWFEQDQLVLSLLISSLSEKLIAQVMRHKTSRAMWFALETMFSQQSQAKYLQLHQQLTHLKKGGESISEYFQKATLLADSLVSTGNPVSDRDFNIYLLGGLGPDFDSVVTSLTTRQDILTPEEILSHLLTYEAR